MLEGKVPIQLGSCMIFFTDKSDCETAEMLINKAKNKKRRGNVMGFKL
jgi:hypothetical protein